MRTRGKPRCMAASCCCSFTAVAGGLVGGAQAAKTPDPGQFRVDLLTEMVDHFPAVGSNLQVIAERGDSLFASPQVTFPLIQYVAADFRLNDTEHSDPRQEAREGGSLGLSELRQLLQQLLAARWSQSVLFAGLAALAGNGFPGYPTCAGEAAQ